MGFPLEDIVGQAVSGSPNFEVLGLNLAQNFLFVKEQRSIAGIQPDVTLEEDHDDHLTITRHPIENGPSISDHAYKEMAEFEIRCGFSTSALRGAFNPGYLRDMYYRFLALQLPPTLITVVTGKRRYDNCLLEHINVTTDKDTENFLMLRFRFVQVILVSTRRVTVPNADIQANPQQTGSVTPQGQKALVPATSFNATGS